MNLSANELTRVRPFRVVERKWEAENVFTLVLEPENGEQMFAFAPGQWVHLHVLSIDGSAWAHAAFTLASAPEESDGGCELGIKVYGEFTKRASGLQPGDRVGLQGPFGVFHLPSDASSLVMFAGGIGVTPFRSMIRSLALREAPLDVILFYSNRYVEGAVYAEEFRRLSRDWPRFRFVMTLTGDDTPQKWDGEVGRVNVEMIGKYVPDMQNTHFLACGSMAFMEAMKEILISNGVDVATRFRIERFG